MNKRILLGVLFITLAALLAFACEESETSVPEPAVPPAGSPGFGEPESRQIALEYLTNSPTYLFDGISETVTLVDAVTEETAETWTFVYAFDSRAAGYGDRTDRILAQVITPHRAVITVEQGNVTGAIMDETWDMQRQAFIGEPPAAPPLAQ